VEWELAGETVLLGENLPQSRFVPHKSYMTWPGLETRAAAVGSRRPTARVTARPYGILSFPAIQDSILLKIY
jgi:hypothetical protein